LVVMDDGCGFDPSSVPPGHLGVGIMRERAESIGADLMIGPCEEHGTRVAVRWRDPEAQAADEQSASARLSNKPSGASPLLTNASAPAASARSRSSGRVLK